MRRLSGTIALLALMMSPLSLSPLDAQGTGIISGVVSGPKGPLDAVTVNVLDRTGTVVRTAVTSSAGGYRIENLPVGTYTIQVTGNGGAVLATGTGTVTATAATSTVNLMATTGQLAAAGAAISAKSAYALAVVAGAGVSGLVAVKGDPSPNR